VEDDAMVCDGVANVVISLQESGFDPRKVGPDSWESRCPAHRSAEWALSTARSEHKHVLLECRSTQNCQDARIIGALGLKNEHVYAKTPDWLISRLARVPIQPASIASPDATDSNEAGASAVGTPEGSDASADGSQNALPGLLEVGAQGDAMPSQALSAFPIFLPTSPASPIEQMLGSDLELHVSSIALIEETGDRRATQSSVRVLTRRTRIAYSTTTISLFAKDNHAHSASCYLLARSIYPRLGSAPTHAALLCVSFHLERLNCSA
jgi:hypothetical protein